MNLAKRMQSTKHQQRKEQEYKQKRFTTDGTLWNIVIHADYYDIFNTPCAILHVCY